jgi:hypothetical protein
MNTQYGVSATQFGNSEYEYDDLPADFYQLGYMT